MLRLATALLLPLLLGAGYRATDSRACRVGGRSRMCMSVGQAGGGMFPAALFTLLPPNGAGVPVMDPSGVCDAFASELVGSYVCLRGDGTGLRGTGVTLTSFGGVTTTTPRVCPNGIDCDPVTVQSFDTIASSQISTNTIPTPAGDFSMCVVGRVRGEGGDVAPMILNSGNTHLQARVQSQPTNMRWLVGATHILVANPTPTGGWYFICGTYQRISGGANNVGVLYSNGVSVGTSSTMATPTGTVLALGAPTSPQIPNDIGLAVYTEKVLSPATIAAMSAKVFGAPLSAVGGLAVTQTRNSTMSCADQHGGLVVLPSGRPCIVKPAGYSGPTVLLEGGRSNATIRSQELDTWTAGGVVATSNTTTAPDATLTAETLTDDATTGTHLVSRANTLTTGLGHAVSAFFRAGTKSVGVIKYAATHEGYVDLATGAASVVGPNATATAEAFSNGWWRLKVGVAFSSATANPTIAVGMADAVGGISYTGDGTGTITAWGVQLEAGALASSYVRSDGSVVTRTDSRITTPMPAGMNNALGCVAASGMLDQFILNSSYSALVGAGAGPERVGGGGVASACIASDGTLSPEALSPDMRTGVRRCRSVWGDPTLRTESELTQNTAAYDGAMLGPTLTVGNSGGGNLPLNGWVGNVKTGGHPDACR